MYNKFIVTLDGTLKMGNVYLHRELLPEGDNTCYGGGLWKVDNQRGCILLFGRSFDFGFPELNRVQKVRYYRDIALGFPIFYMRQWMEEEILEPVWPNSSI